MRFHRLCAVLALILALSGCYSYVPVQTSAGVQSGEHIAVDITDRGRAELGDKLGSGVTRIEGTLTRTDSVDIEMSVWRVAQIGGPTAQWSGESVRLKREYTSTMQTRTLNRGKTYLVAGAAVAGAVLLTKSIGLLGFASGDGDGGEQPPPQTSRGWWN